MSQIRKTSWLQFQCIKIKKVLIRRNRGCYYWWVSSTPFDIPFLSTSSILEYCLKSEHQLKMTSSEGFQHHLRKNGCSCYMNKNVAFNLSLLLFRNEINVYPFNCHLSYWLRYQQSQKLNLLVQNVNFELLSIMQMKPTTVLEGHQKCCDSVTLSE